MRFRTQAVALLVTMLGASVSGFAGTSIVFSQDEIAIIRDYYAQSPDTAAKGKAGKQKNQGLPPGIAKNLARGKPLPPGIAKKSLPGDLVRRLPPVNAGYERVVVDGRVLLVEVATQIIHDILVDTILN